MRYNDGMTERRRRKLSLLMVIQKRSKQRQPMTPAACRTWMSLNYGTRHNTTDDYLREWERDCIIKLNIDNKYEVVLTVEQVVDLVKKAEEEVRELMESIP